MANIASGLHVEWGQSQACQDQWQEGVMLITEEMQCNITYCGYKGLCWHGLSVNQGGHALSARRSGTLSNPSQPSTNAALQDGQASYALKQARDKVLLLNILTAMWHPLYTKWKQHPLVGPLLIDPEFDNLSPASVSTVYQKAQQATSQK
jgi:hypothetical protein